MGPNQWAWNLPLSRFRGMMNTPQLAAPFLGVAIFDTARLAAQSFIITAFMSLFKVKRRP
jgi:hypothetical protein